MATGTLTPWPRYTVLNSAGKPISGALLNTYIAGTATPIATYSDVGLTTPNANPIVANSSGQIGPVFLTPGSSYKFLFTNPDGSQLYSQDNIAAAGGAANTDVIGTAGEALTAGQAVYLSDGSGGKAAGSWFKADNANTYSSTTPEVGVVPASISNGATGIIRTGGQATGMSSLTVGTVYYIGTAGAVTSTQPTNARIIGQADSTTTMILGFIPVQGTTQFICNGRLTLTTAVPVTTADVTAATTLFFTPYAGGQIALYSGTVWNLRTLTEISIAVPATTVQMYDVFCFDNSGTPALELTAWTNDTTRATALTTQNGVLVKSGTTTRRYLGSCRTTSVSGQTEDSFTKRFVWNYYNRVMRTLKVFEATDSWGYNTAAYRQARATATNQVECVIGVAEVEAMLILTAMSKNDVAADNTFVSISDQATTISTTPDTNVTGQALLSNASATQITPGRAELRKYPAVGHHVFGWLEQGSGANNTTWYGDNGAATKYQSGILGTIQG